MRKDASSVAKALVRHVFLDMCGFPLILRSDNGVEFTASLVSEMKQLLGIQGVHGTAYHPQSQGMVERIHRTLNESLRTTAKDYPGEWEERIPFIRFGLNNMPRKSLGNRTPYEGVTGLRIRMPALSNFGGAEGPIATDK